ncbi:MAG: N-acetylmuramoyl-L-alanine amidase [Clostridiales bacterium]|nr:N-acetylmuramoyl-L-alanine amidase [Clostridiales bacterium]
MNDYIIAVGGADAGFTPSMPFVGRKFDGAKIAGLARLMLEIALVRCGFDISDRSTPITDTQEMIFQANRSGADCIIVLSCDAFGSRKSFNDVKGGTVKYSIGRHGARSRELAEDVCAKIGGAVDCKTTMCNHEWNGAACPAIVVEMGYLTNFDEAKLMCDPDYIHNIAEYATMGICEYFGMPYIPHSPAAYKPLSAKIGLRGKYIKLLQAALCCNGYPVEIDGVYGKNTDLAVKEFCINNESKDDYLRDLLFFAPRDIQLESKHNGVLYIQRKLNAKLYSAPTSGTLCPDTVIAINEYLTETENAHLVAQDGINEDATKLLTQIGGGRPRLF